MRNTSNGFAFLKEPQIKLVKPTGSVFERNKDKKKEDPKQQQDRDGDGKQTSHAPSETLVDKHSGLELANAALDEDFRIQDDEYGNFCDENGIPKGEKNSLIKAIHFKMISKLMDARVRVKDLASVVFLGLFEKHSKENPKFNMCRTMQLADWKTFLKELEMIFLPFDEIHPHLNRDVKMLTNFAADKNISDDQFYFVQYLDNVQHCLSFPDLLRVCEIKTCFGFSDNNFFPDVVRIPETRGVLEDYKSKNRPDLISLFIKHSTAAALQSEIKANTEGASGSSPALPGAEDELVKRSQSANSASLDKPSKQSPIKARGDPEAKLHTRMLPASEHFWYFHDVFDKEVSSMKFFIKEVAEEGEKDSTLERNPTPHLGNKAPPKMQQLKRTQEHYKSFKEGLQEFFFSYMKLNPLMQESLGAVPVSWDFFWYSLYFMIETGKVHFSYEKYKSEATEDAKSSLKKTLMEYQDKLKETTNPQVEEALKHTIDHLQKQILTLEKPEHKAASRLLELQRDWKKALKEIFMFYSKQQKVLTNTKTFDNYKEECTNLSVGEFLKFCRDFGLNPQHWDWRSGLDGSEANHPNRMIAEPKNQQIVKKLAKELNNVTLSSIYKLEALGNLGIGYDSFEKIVKKVAVKISEVYGFEEEKLLDVFTKLGLLDGAFTQKMKTISKPFINGLQHPIFSPFKKPEDTTPVPVKLPNFKANQQVFARLYDRALADSQTKQIIRDLNDQGPRTVASINKNTGMVETQGMRASASQKQQFGVKNSRLAALSAQSNSMGRMYPVSNPTGGVPSAKSILKEQNSYVIRERARHLQDNNKKFTWEGLEKMNINELKGITQLNFDPASLIGVEDEEDKLYMQEYLKLNESPARRDAKSALKKEQERRQLESYGGVKKSLPSASGGGIFGRGEQNAYMGGMPPQQDRYSAAGPTASAQYMQIRASGKSGVKKPSVGFVNQRYEPPQPGNYRKGMMASESQG